MTVHQTSRYRFFDTQQVIDSSGITNKVHKVRKTSIAPIAGFRLYTTKSGDTFETIASREYSDARKWYVLADANPQVFFMLDLQVGAQIVIPNKSYAVLS